MKQRSRDNLSERDLTRTTKEDKTIIHLFERNLTLILRQAQNQFYKKGINTMRRRLYESKMEYYDLQSKNLSQTKTRHKTTGISS